MLEQARKLRVPLALRNEILQKMNSGWKKETASRLDVARFGSVKDNLHDEPNYSLFWL